MNLTPREKDKLLGHFGFDLNLDHPFLGPYGGFNIVLSKSIQGLRLGQAAYMTMVSRMSTLGVKTIFGRTSNPAVIGLSLKMGRQLRRLLLRRDPPFIAQEVLAPLLP